MQGKSGCEPLWAAYTVWAVVNAVNLLQAIGFLSRILTGGTRVNHLLGFAILALAVPAAVALAAFVRAGAGWMCLAGPIAFLGFAAIMGVVDYAHPVEFRSPPRPGILGPFLLLFFSSIFLMGLPMFRLNRRLWVVTVATTVVLLAAMAAAMRRGLA